jgi:hypothetical protein
VKYWDGVTPLRSKEKKLLHLHILLLIALFDRLRSMLWSTSEEVRRKAKDELTKYITQTMSSSYEVVDEDYTHENRKRN